MPTFSDAFKSFTPNQFRSHLDTIVFKVNGLSTSAKNFLYYKSVNRVPSLDVQVNTDLMRLQFTTEFL
jgi:threonine/homoserine efflux transporter RhtA